MVARATDPTGAPQMLQQLFLQGTAGLDEEASVDGLVWTPGSGLLYADAVSPRLAESRIPLLTLRRTLLDDCYGGDCRRNLVWCPTMNFHKP